MFSRLHIDIDAKISKIILCKIVKYNSPLFKMEMKSSITEWVRQKINELVWLSKVVPEINLP